MNDVDGYFARYARVSLLNLRLPVVCSTSRWCFRVLLISTAEEQECGGETIGERRTADLPDGRLQRLWDRTDDALDVPELPEVTSTLIRRIFSPQQLSRRFMIYSHHVRLNELLVVLQQRDAVFLDPVDVRQEEF